MFDHHHCGVRHIYADLDHSCRDKNVQIAAPEELRALFEMLTGGSARLLNLKDYGLAPGNPADLVVIDAATPEQAIAEIRPPLAVWKRGKRTVTRHPPKLHAPG